MKRYIPISLIIFRLLLAPTIIVITYYLRENAKIIVLVLLYLGLISDILDGVVARHLKVSSAKLRRYDSQTDLVFWLSIGVATWMLYPELISNNSIPIILLFVMEAACYFVSIIKFGKETCTHAFLSKLWGISLLAAFTSLIGLSYAGFPFAVAIILGLISQLDVILIILILPEWTHDIPSCYHAYLIRKGIGFKRNKFLNDD
jgi:phosphatidylglycerophosphate synthase